MGEAKRKAKEWIRLFPSGAAMVAISHPGTRPHSTKKYEPGYAAHIIAARADGKPALCINPDGDHKLLTTPEVRAFIKTSADPHAQPIGVGVCEACAALSDEALAMARKHLDHYGLSGAPPEGAALVRVDLKDCVEFRAVSVSIVTTRLEIDDLPICDVANVLRILLESRARRS